MRKGSFHAGEFGELTDKKLQPAPQGRPAVGERGGGAQVPVGICDAAAQHPPRAQGSSQVDSARVVVFERPG
jgi:hypothetical protein